MIWTITVIAILMVSIVVMYNKIITGMNRARRAWSDVIAYEKLKNDLIPQLNEVVSSFKDFESTFIENVTKLRESISNLHENKIDINALNNTEQLSNSLFSQLKVTAENYPELASSELYQDLIKQIAEKNDNVAAAITIYNRGVELFNNTIEMFPINLVNTMFASKDKLQSFHQKNTVENYDYKPNFS